MNADRIAALEGLITRYQASYYAGEAEITDAEFDQLWDELKRLDPASPVLARVGSEAGDAGGVNDGADGFPKTRHLIPMGSQDKAANPGEFLDWAAKTRAASYVVQYKLDGASLELQYDRGKLLAAVTRGDGTVGDEITANALRMEGVVDNLRVKKFTGGVRGEVVMKRGIWRARHTGKANCRNAANGIMRRKDGAGCEDLSLIVYDAAMTGDDGFFTDELVKLDWLRKRGFAVAETREFTRPEDIVAYREEVAAARPDLDVDIDGLVVKDRATNMADLRRARPERQIAFKFSLEEAVSVLRGVAWSESGATYTPIGMIDPVRLAGTTVRRANLNNPDMIRGLGIRIGSAVRVVKRGEIIPKIEGLAGVGEGRGDGEAPVDVSPDTAIVFPTTCRVCGTALVDAGTRLYCPNPACPKRLLHRLFKWVKVLDIRELGDKLVRQIFSTGRVTRVGDLYTLEPGELAALDRMGEVSAAKVVRHIRAPRRVSLAAFVAGFDLEGVGETIMDKVAAAGFDTLPALRGATVEALAGVYGLGEITARTIVEGLQECAADMDRVLAQGIISIAPPAPAEAAPLRGLSFCFTGELAAMKRSEAEERVKALGGTVKSSVVKDLSYLVTNDPESGSAKNRKAAALGVPALGEEAFLALLAGRPVEAAGAAAQGDLFG